MPDYRNVMVDIETTGTSPDRHAMIQLSAVRFDLETGEVDPDTFDRCLFIPPWRGWSESTRSWWGKQKREIIEEIFSRMEDPAVVLNDFRNWLAPHVGLIFWSKPTSFDFPFLSSYFNDYDLQNPFHYRYAQDVNTFIRARWHPHGVIEPSPLEGNGDAHNAIFDCFDQINKVIHAYHTTRQDDPAG